MQNDVGKSGHDFTYLVNKFLEVKGITIQQFIILHKIEKVKESLIYDALNLAEISYKLHYSRVAHLSIQFKKIIGPTSTFYNQLKEKRAAKATKRKRESGLKFFPEM